MPISPLQYQNKLFLNHPGGQGETLNSKRDGSFTSAPVYHPGWVTESSEGAGGCGPDAHGTHTTTPDPQDRQLNEVGYSPLQKNI